MPVPAAVGAAALVARLLAGGAAKEAAKKAAAKAAAEAARKRMLQSGVKVVKPGNNTQSASALKAAKEAARAKKNTKIYKRQDQVEAQNWNNVRTNRIAKEAIAEVAKKNGVPYPTKQSQMTPEMIKAMNKALNEAKMGFRKVTDLRYPYKKN
jgi:hypothetical protein